MEIAPASPLVRPWQKWPRLRQHSGVLHIKPRRCRIPLAAALTHRKPNTRARLRLRLGGWLQPQILDGNWGGWQIEVAPNLRERPNRT